MEFHSWVPSHGDKDRKAEEIKAYMNQFIDDVVLTQLSKYHPLISDSNT